MQLADELRLGTFVLLGLFLLLVYFVSRAVEVVDALVRAHCISFRHIHARKRFFAKHLDLLPISTAAARQCFPRYRVRCRSCCFSCWVRRCVCAWSWCRIVAGLVTFAFLCPVAAFPFALSLGVKVRTNVSIDLYDWSVNCWSSDILSELLARLERGVSCFAPVATLLLALCSLERRATFFGTNIKRKGEQKKREKEGRRAREREIQYLNVRY